MRFTLAIGLTAEELDALHSLDLVLVQSEVSAYNGVALPQDGACPHRIPTVAGVPRMRRAVLRIARCA